MFFKYVSGKIKPSESPCGSRVNYSVTCKQHLPESYLRLMLCFYDCSLMTSDLLVLYCNNLSISSIVHASVYTYIRMLCIYKLLLSNVNVVHWNTNSRLMRIHFVNR